MDRRLLPLFTVVAALAGCASNNVGSGLPSGAMAYGVIPAASSAVAAADYRIGPLDALDITILQEPDLSTKVAPVDAAGNVNLALIGDVRASGRTANELAREIAARYGQRYLRNPQVSVVVARPVAQKVAVQGEVVQPGVYPIEGPTTLLGALSLAKGETQLAALNDVVVFRTVEGRRAGAVFDIRQIRSGQAPDPQIRTDDMIIVGYSGGRRAWRDIVNSMPILNIFRPLPL
ncbi:polysaccharide export protein [Sphingomonas ginkgonis]|uniref:Polysaccharide export protein n=1 Tax=Sphingomonas ginkgonis TaxID=2315330 RepID=A0A3S0EN92_9SPHN|nr:polysaccharide biosynthesis/export family protein [Sphingomonas ginkgonis]RST31446.1 polysaccharide export protein [Sphingomonas ginkgonis]